MPARVEAHVEGGPLERADLNGRAQGDHLVREGVLDLVDVTKHSRVLDLLVRRQRQVVRTKDHVLSRLGNGPTRGRGEDVVRREHQDARLGLRLGGQRHVNGHLVTVEVGVERLADEGVDLDGLAVDEDRLEGLDTQSVQRRRAVEQHRVFADDLFEDVPHHGLTPFDHALGALDVLRHLGLDQTLHDEGLEEFQRHHLGQDRTGAT